MHEEAPDPNRKLALRAIAEINLSCPHEVSRGTQRRHGVGVVMEILLRQLSIHLTGYVRLHVTGKLVGVVDVTELPRGLFSSVPPLPLCFSCLAQSETRWYENNSTFPHCTDAGDAWSRRIVCRRILEI